MNKRENDSFSYRKAKQIDCSIESEYDRLEIVLVHKPGTEIDRLTPLNKERLLFEDIPFLDRMQREHDQFTSLMRENGVQVLYLGDFVKDILKDSKIRRKLINETCGMSGQNSLTNIILDNYSISEIREILFSGITASEILEKTGLELISTNPHDDFFIIEPIPNAYFSRDAGVILDDCFISCKAHFSARIRETTILRNIFLHHPAFKRCDTIFGANDDEDRPFTIEGGDIIIINEQAVMVGCSQRTRAESIVRFAKKLFSSGRFQRVYEINIPIAREYMHLDTVFTIIDKGIVVAFPDVIDNIFEIRRYEPLYTFGNELIAFPQKEERRFKQILEDEFSHPLSVINTGNNDIKYAAREQGADGTNMFAIAPGKVISYQRNVHTNAAMKAFGIDVIEIEGSELVRGLGGPRCMTMPLKRSSSKK